MSKILKLALIGTDVSKSSSRKIHEFILNELGYACEFELISLPESELGKGLSRLFREFDGFNVTTPYKRSVMPYLNEIIGDAREYSSVNTVISATKTGYNTDGLGFMQALKSAGCLVNGKKTLVLGGGGAGRSTALSLKKAGADVYMYRRNRAELEKTCKELGVKVACDVELGGYELIINATGVGAKDTEGLSPVSKNAFDGGRVAMDLIYTPEQTEFLRLAKECGLSVLNGFAMLFYQAYYADCYYLSRQADEKEMEELYQKYWQVHSI